MRAGMRARTRGRAVDRAEIEKLIETLERGQLHERLPVGTARSEDIAQALGKLDDEFVEICFRRGYAWAEAELRYW